MSRYDRDSAVERATRRATERDRKQRQRGREELRRAAQRWRLRDRGTPLAEYLRAAHEVAAESWFEAEEPE